jgi:hypothetical protein
MFDLIPRQVVQARVDLEAALGLRKIGLEPLIVEANAVGTGTIEKRGAVEISGIVLGNFRQLDRVVSIRVQDDLAAAGNPVELRPAIGSGRRGRRSAFAVGCRDR